MGTNTAALTQCLELSRNISALGVGINSIRAARELYTQLIETSADLGASITSVDYVPMRSQRTQAAVDSMKQVCKVIYLLNVASESGYFVKDAVKAAIKSAVKLSELLVSITSTYDGTAEANAAAAAAPAVDKGATAVATAAPTATAPEDVALHIEDVNQDYEENFDPDGFNEPYVEEE